MIRKIVESIHYSILDDQKYLFQLSKDVSRIWNQLESLLSKVDSHNSRPDGPQTCDKINTSYLYYAIQKENIRLKDELKITKSRKGKRFLLFY